MDERCGAKFSTVIAGEEPCSVSELEIMQFGLAFSKAERTVRSKAEEKVKKRKA